MKTYSVAVKANLMGYLFTAKALWKCDFVNAKVFVKAYLSVDSIIVQ